METAMDISYAETYVHMKNGTVIDLLKERNLEEVRILHHQDYCDGVPVDLFAIQLTKDQFILLLWRNGLSLQEISELSGDLTQLT